MAIAGLAGLKSPAIVKDATTIDTVLVTARLVPILKTFPSSLSSNFPHILPSSVDISVNSSDVFVTNFEFLILRKVL